MRTGVVLSLLSETLLYPPFIARIMAAVNLLSFENPVFSLYAFCSACLLLKTILMAVLVGRQRVTKKCYASPEDNVLAGMKPELKPPNPDVERVRRAHLNDLENIFPFVFIGLFYVLTNPSLTMAKLYFTIFTLFRFAHTVIFLNAIPQPARTLVFIIASAVNTLMATSVILHALPLCLAAF